MGLTAKQRRVFDKSQSIQKSHKEAVKLHESNVAKQKQTKAKKAEEGLIKKTKRRLRELYYGDKTYLPKKKKGKK